MDTNSSVSRHPKLALPQVLEISKQPLHITTAMRSALNFTLACVFRLLCSHSAPASPPHWGFWRDKGDFCLRPERRRALWVCQETAQEDPTAGPSKGPRYHSPSRELLLCQTQPEPRPPVSHPESGPHILQVGTALTRGRHLEPTCVFRYLSPERSSNSCLWWMQMQKRVPLLPHATKTGY